MRTLFLVITLSFLLFSCSKHDDDSNQTLETIPVSQVDMPTKFAKDSITEIPLSYIRPTVCHSFYDFYYYRDGNTRTVAIITLNQNTGNCPVSQTTYTIPLKFKPIALGTYHFKFWIGTDSQGVDQYAEYDAVVNH
ncbi:hypothetical protein [Flavobacterium aciduliphilum]|uniref:Lipoprotein n=1 Tax=Flavobacterium aciduliphilum TaxID=1101402 RepID=A0A328YFN0_9FLAO|nr:hypothetical protein [Flavobacterium aciduliphilum]RAR72828.1 hypothetical protein CLV55_10488 [Flavobacterium aciduliphilum]